MAMPLLSMIRISVPISFFLIFSLFSLGSSSPSLRAEEASGTQKVGIIQLYEKLNNIEIDTSRAARLENFSFKKDIFEWKFDSGYLYFTQTVSECPEAGGAYFIGKGRMLFEPPNIIERDQLKEYTDKERIDEPFSEAFLRFNDDTRAVFEPLMQSAPGSEGSKAKSNFQSRQDLLSDLTFNLTFPVIEDHLSGVRRNQYLYIETDADIKEQGTKGWPAVFYNPLDFEEVSFFIHKRIDKGDFSNFLVYTSICKFHSKEDYEQRIDREREDKDLFHIFHYDMNFTVIKHDLFLDALVRVHLRPLVNDLSAVQMPLWAYYDPDRHDKYITINRITDAEGNDLLFIYKNFTVLVQLPRKLNKGDEVVLNFDYRGDFIRPDFSVPPSMRIPVSWDFLPESESTFTLLNIKPWFPQYGFHKSYTFEMTIKVPKPHSAVTSGTTVKRWEEGDYNCLHSKESTPVKGASFLFGKYFTIKDDSKKPVLYVHSLFKQQRQREGIIEEARTIITEYEKYLGPFPYDELDIAQMGFFYGFGQAPPGLVQLTGEAFLTSSQISSTGYSPHLRSEFLSHEIGHQWWGNRLGWKNYHQQWLSESFTEYLSGLYLEATKGAQPFKDKLTEWKEHAEMSKSSGPIWLSNRLAKNRFRRFDYTNALYYKGPYVLHMLRMAFIFRFGTEKGNQIFFDCLKNFCTEYGGQLTITEDFQKIVKQTTQVDMDWFFDQWYRSAGFPELHCSYKTSQTEDGKYLVEAKIRQANTDHIKALIVPVFFHFSGDRVIRKDMFTNKEEGLLQIKLPEKPELMTVDDSMELLAMVTYE